MHPNKLERPRDRIKRIKLSTQLPLLIPNAPSKALTDSNFFHSTAQKEENKKQNKNKKVTSLIPFSNKYQT